MASKDLNERDVFITLINFGRETRLDGVTPKEALDRLQKEHPDIQIETDAQKANFANLFWQIFEVETESGPVPFSNLIVWEQKFLIRRDAYFNALDFEELQQARQSSKQAQWWAIIAILISIISLGVSIYFSNKQLHNASRIDEVQLKQLTPAIYDLKSIEQKLDNLIKLQNCTNER